MPGAVVVLSRALLSAVLLICAAPLRAEPVEDFYKGRTVTVAFGTEPVGTYHIYAQMTAEYLARYLPGKPSIIVQSMPGAGGLRAVNHLYNVAPRDGTYMLVVVQTVATDQVLERAGTKYDARKFNYIGRYSDNTPVVVGWKAAGVKSAQAFKEREVIIGGTGAASPTDVIPKLLNELAGTKFKLVSGYKGINETALAMERGETQSMIASLATFQSIFAPLIREGKASILLQSAVTRHKDIPQTPTVGEYMTTPEGRGVADFMATSSDIGRSLIAPPDVPAERVTALQQAFAEMVKSPAFLKDAAGRNIDVNPATGSELMKVVEMTLRAPPGVAALAKKILDVR